MWVRSSEPAFDVKGVVHRTRRMILGLIQRGEVVPVGFDFRAVGDIEPDRAENLLDPLPGADHGMDAAEAAAAPRQRDIEGFLAPGALQSDCV